MRGYGDTGCTGTAQNEHPRDMFYAAYQTLEADIRTASNARNESPRFVAETRFFFFLFSTSLLPSEAERGSVRRK
jgi:hypothetical protein